MYSAPIGLSLACPCGLSLDYLWRVPVDYLLDYLLDYRHGLSPRIIYWIIATDYIRIISARYLPDYLWCASVDYLRIIWGVTPKGGNLQLLFTVTPSDFSLEFSSSHTLVPLKSNS